MPKRLWQLCTMHKQSPPHYNSVSVFRKYVFQKTACDLCHTHKCPVSTVGATWGKSPWHISIELCAARPSVGFPCPAGATCLALGRAGRFPGSEEFIKMFFLIFPGFNPSCKGAGEKLTSGFVKMSRLNIPTPLPTHTFKGVEQNRKEKKG